MNKYYIPELEELNFLFEFEIYNSKEKYFFETFPEGWYKTSIGYGVLGNLENLTKLILDKQIRVKVLDKQDIESLGFNFLEKESLGDLTHRYEIKGIYQRILDGYDDTMFWNLYLRHFPDRNIVKIEGDISTGDREVFVELAIKNKSELKRLIKQLGIKELKPELV